MPDKIFYGCWKVFKDGTKCLIKTNWGEGCLVPTNKPFWKRPEDVENKVKTMTQEMDKDLATNAYIKQYFNKLQEKESEKRSKNNQNYMHIYIFLSNN